MAYVRRFVFPAMWLSRAIYWFALSRNVKSTMRREPWTSRFMHIVPLAIAVCLLGIRNLPIAVPSERVLPLAPWPFWFGTALGAGGLLLTVRARLHLGTNCSGTVTIKKGRELITSGLYSLVRHPIYTGLLLPFLGQVTGCRLA
jgi:protein-S-isoprenylcysteine O-methyltransferase Ste14